MDIKGEATMISSALNKLTEHYCANLSLGTILIRIPLILCIIMYNLLAYYRVKATPL